MSNRAQHTECRRSLDWDEQPDEDCPAFTAWLRQEFSRIYDPVLQEPLPPALLQLLDAGPGHTAR